PPATWTHAALADAGQTRCTALLPWLCSLSRAVPRHALVSCAGEAGRHTTAGTTALTPGDAGLLTVGATGFTGGTTRICRSLRDSAQCGFGLRLQHEFGGISPAAGPHTRTQRDRCRAEFCCVRQ